MPYTDEHTEVYHVSLRLNNQTSLLVSERVLGHGRDDWLQGTSILHDSSFDDIDVDRRCIVHLRRGYLRCLVAVCPCRTF